MTLRPILLHPDPRLKKPCATVTVVTDDVRLAAADMLQTMYGAPGIGLAAPQIGLTIRLFVMDCVKDPEATPRPMVLLNPELIWESEARNIYEEGCLSIPDLYAEVERPAEIGMRWMGLDGATYEEKFSGLWATCAQHEMDHLDGKLFIDYLSPLKRQLFTRKMEKYKRDLARG